ncbi:MAG: FHA domain-containing protein [Myxococcota bacterium]
MSAIRLQQRGGTHSGRSLVFDASPVRIGRLPECELALDAHADLDVSGQHAELQRDGEGWTVVDAVSRNGTYVNDVRVGRHRLKAGDRIRLGENGPVFEVQFEASKAIPPEHARWAPGGAAAQPPAPAVGAAAPSSAQQRWGPPASASAQTPSAWGTAAQPSGGASGSASHGAPQSSPGAAQPSYGAPQSSPSAAQPSYGAPQSSPGAAQPPYGASHASPQPAGAPNAAPKPSRLPWAIGCSVATLALAVVVVALWAVVSSGPFDATAVAVANEPALVHLVAGEGAPPLCSGVAVGDRLVATSAACIDSLESQQQTGVFVTVRAARQRLNVERLWRHPNASPGIAAFDVGLVQTDATVPLVANLGRSPLERDHAVALDRQPGGVLSTPVIYAAGAEEAVLGHAAAGVRGGTPHFDRTGSVVGLEVGLGNRMQVVGIDAVRSLIAGLEANP